MKLSLLRFCLLLVLLFALAACGSDPEPTPTPTKTPEGAGEPSVVVATDTPATQQGAAGSQPQPADTPVPTPAPVTEEKTEATVNADGGLNLRNDPSATGTIIRIADKGETFTVVSKSPDGQWLQVAQNGQTVGWLAAEFVDLKTVQVTTQNPSSPDAQATATPAANTNAPGPAISMRSPEFGAQAFLWWKPELASHDLDMMHKANFDWVKQTFAWETIEGAGSGQYDWSIADRVVKDVSDHGLKLLVRLSVDPKLTNFWAGAPPSNGDAFASFASAVASRYNCAQPTRCIQAFQVWNEPNLAREWGGKRPNPAEYAAFLGKAYRAIKAANPNAIVISAGMAPTGSNDNNAMPDDVFYEEMYKAMGSSNGYFDMLGVHGAGFAAPPELDPAEAAANKPQYGGYRFFAFRHVEDIRAIMERYGDSNKKIVLLEFGWTFDSINPDYKWHGADAGITDKVQGDYLKRAYQYAAQHWPWVGLMSLLTMPNADWLADGNPKDEEQYWWAIMEPADTVQTLFRPAYIDLCIYFNSVKGQSCEFDPNK